MIGLKFKKKKSTNKAHIPSDICHKERLPQEQPATFFWGGGGVNIIRFHFCGRASVDKSEVNTIESSSGVNAVSMLTKTNPL